MIALEEANKNVRAFQKNIAEETARHKMEHWRIIFW